MEDNLCMITRHENCKRSKVNKQKKADKVNMFDTRMTNMASNDVIM
ncbi:unnamed protein product [Brassica napus]|uniref:(rape) hypothetical protein n=1 Tax=Brassica napus TaxID=3708 RepID=A0A816ZXR1_BRANA|nr:unnamed protein product [Brassica napus]